MISDVLLQRALVMLPNNDAGGALSQDIREYLREFTELDVVDYSTIRDEAVDLLNGILATARYKHNAFIERLRDCCRTNSANSKRIIQLHNHIRDSYTVELFFQTINRDRSWKYPPYNEGVLSEGRVRC